MAAVQSVVLPKSYKTWVAKPGEVRQKWYVVDATGLPLGRLASAVAMRLMGKAKPTYTPHTDTGDFVVILNAERIHFDPRKLGNKTYQQWSGYLGGLKVQTLEDVLSKQPERVIEHAVRLMLPKGILGKKMFTKLKVYKGDKHPHQAQQPEAWTPMAKKKR